MSTEVVPNFQSSALNPVGSAGSVQQRGDLQGRAVKVIYKDDFENYKKELKGALYNAFSEKMNDKIKGVLYAIAGVVLIIAAVAIVCYLNAVIPVTYVWPGVSKLLVAIGVTALGMGGLFSLALADEAFQRGSDISSVSRLVDRQSTNVVTYRGDNAHLQRV